MLRQALAFIIALSAILAIFLWTETFSSTYQYCISQDAHDNGEQAAKKHDGGIGVILVTRLRCTARFINDHNGGITALATLVIAAFTGTLWFATNQQARLTR